ncbi:unnamed protein product [Zymoseptoria tritici ST99CH_3D1]|uniref:MHD domain-containing protein n=1 Tax=Zymoseptoria tritici ST99CH_1E4 TaxID=1276532 RepID=A0A2H1FKP0_ZYMTR|nr:unnamed protein product [Zymoseptoria tritici ST99CH_1E4]SMR44047.1 unnamed protein product [Zymoseptoria tritici ST99CH_3D1]
MSVIEALYIFDEHNNLLFDHVYTNRPPPPSTLLPLYLQHASPRPSVSYLTSTSPPTILFSVIQDNLLLLSPSSSDIEPLLVLEFLHRVADALEEFLGSPLLSTKLTANYDIVAQVVAEMADSGVICQGEANALRDVVETGPGVLKNLLGGVGLPGASPALQGPGASNLYRPQVLAQSQTSQGSAVPWRRSNVRHTSNELYVDIVETLSVTLAPSGRPLAAFANGSIAFTSKVSGVPDLLLSLSTGGKGAGMGNRGDQLRNVMERVVFHPCVRLNKWKSEGVLSFVPPDGRFALCGYEADLLGPNTPLTTNNSSSSNLDLPAKIEITTGMGSVGTEFEVRVSQSTTSSSGARSPAAASLQSNLGVNRSGSFRPPAGDSKSPALEDLTIHVPIPASVRNVSDLRPTRGEASWQAAESTVEWKISPKDLGPGGVVLRCTVQGPLSDEDADVGTINGMSATTYDYDEENGAEYQSSQDRNPGSITPSNGTDRNGKIEKNKDLMPTCALLSFSIKGWLASGLKVESLLIDTKKSRGLGPEVKPYKGVKYLTVSRQGIELRC